MKNYKQEIIHRANVIRDLIDKAKMWLLKLKARNTLTSLTEEQLEASYDAMSQAISLSQNMVDVSEDFAKAKNDTINECEEMRDAILKEMQRRNMKGVQQLTGGKPYYVKS